VGETNHTYTTLPDLRQLSGYLQGLQTGK